ncbi:Glucomannan 4-beta-mannosyltransferase 2 [Heracleum sosnowskyi]|uniref:Glucomannan 4-beta-mannosyltransferase 2 n=1 Tax=Heracleum sosnowskyi TaxID=360622 RepID=A0AAD8ICU2_9APIA|nr:Glucomannan 4-beta-mannosyltransferase 2 [Heracleum sosnowskyi]
MYFLFIRGGKYTEEDAKLIVVQILRKGYKSGALKDGLTHQDMKDCEYVAIFDADFQPDPDFLLRSIPYLVHNPEIALVQARWVFVNADECLLTRMQEMSFGLSFYSGARNLQVKSELPSTFQAFWFQQHRWSCGPANLFRKMFMEIIRNKTVTWYKKVYVIYSFFLIRKIMAHIITFSFYCLILPASCWIPEVVIPKWGAVYIPVIITVLNAAGTPRSMHLLMFWILFENVMALHRTKATLIGLLETGRANEWVVTEKLGDASATKKSPQKTPKRARFRLGSRLHMLELAVSAYLFGSACYDYTYGNTRYIIYLYIQSMAFLIMGCGYVGTIVPSS